MKLSLSGRLVETADGPLLTVDEFLATARRCGYDAVDLRASQLGPTTPAGQLADIRAALDRHGLGVFETGWAGNLDGPARDDFRRFADLSAELGAAGVRCAGDLDTLRLAARLAAPAGLSVFYQMHTGGPFETVASAARALEEIREPNVAVLPEPANLLLAGERFAEDMFAPLAGRIGGVHVQTLEARDDADDAVPLADGTEVRYARVPYAANRQIDFATFFAALRRAGFAGHVNELEPCPGPEALEGTLRSAARFLRPLIA